MVALKILGAILLAIAALIGIYTRWYPEDERMGRRVRGRTGADIQRALNRVGKPYRWTDRNLMIIAAILTIAGLVIVILGQVLGN